ncbi:MAG TPA: hypothetical protein VEI07_13475 [Planctomycetaceae bacterium]|nr:hypothetical protein [Planctomycetaceae bacterium]
MKPLRLLVAIALLFAVGHCLAAGNKPQKPAKEKPPSAPLPSFDLVTKEVKRQLALDSEYQEGDLLTAPKVEKILSKLEKVNWKVADAREIVRLVLSDTDWLAVRLSAGDGKAFMRQIARMPGGYDRVDRLRNLPNGENLVTDFIEGPEGFKMIEYMTTTQGGRNLGDYLSEDENGADFNKRTGRIYTEQDLLRRLKESYDAEEARRKGVDPKPSKPGKLTAKNKWKPKSTSKSPRPSRPAPAPEAEEPMAPPEFQDGIPQP